MRKSREPIKAGGGRLARLRADVLARFLDRVDTAVQPAYEDIRQLPGYGDLEQAEATELLRSLRWVFVTLTRCVGEDRSLTAREIERLHGIGVARARWGVPFGAFQQAFAVGFDHAMTRLRELARELGDDGRVADTIVRDLVGRLADAVSAREEGFARMSGGPFSAEAAGQRVFLDSVLEEGATEPQLERMASSLGFSGESDRGLLVAVPRAGADTDLDAVVRETVSDLESRAVGAVRSRPSPHAVVLLGRALDAAACSVLARSAFTHEAAWTAVGGERWTPLGVRYRRLRPFVHVLGVVGAEPGVIDLDDLAPYEPLAYTPLPVAQALCARYLGPVFALRHHDARTWLRTFEELHTCDWVVADAAGHLSVHPNTLYRRLGQFAELTGLDCRSSQGRLLVIQAVYLWHMFGAAMPPFGDSSWS